MQNRVKTNFVLFRYLFQNSISNTLPLAMLLSTFKGNANHDYGFQNKKLKKKIQFQTNTPHRKTNEIYYIFITSCKCSLFQLRTIKEFHFSGQHRHCGRWI